MLKPRIIGTIIVSNNWAVQSVNFQRYLPIGRPEILARYLNAWGVDEILLLDISSGQPNYDLVKKVSRFCFVPLTYGGAIRSVDHIRELLRVGADKVSLNTILFDDLDIVHEASLKFGSQALVGCIDYRMQDGQRLVYRGGREQTARTPSEIADDAERVGIGELLFRAMDRNGMKVGYDSEFFHEISERYQIPVIASGGVGNPEHVLHLLRDSKVAAAAVGNSLNFSEQSVCLLKGYLAHNDIPVRLDLPNSYSENHIDSDGRLVRKSDEELLGLRFKYIEEEVI